MVKLQLRNSGSAGITNPGYWTGGFSRQGGTVAGGSLQSSLEFSHYSLFIDRLQSSLEFSHYSLFIDRLQSSLEFSHYSLFIVH
jgi:hypothetical protein